LACDIGSSPTATPVPSATSAQLVAPTDPPQTIPTAEPSATKPPPTATSEVPTAEPVPTDPPAGPVYFHEEFDTDVNWTFEYITGNTQDQCEGPELRNGGLWWKCRAGEETDLKILNEQYSYQDVVVQAEIENFGTNTNWVSLLCRVSEDGFYEFRFTSGGFYQIFRFDYDLHHAGKTPYIFIGGGATNLMVPGKNANTVAMICAGDEFEFYANGKQIEVNIPLSIRKEYTRLTEGGVGIGYMVSPDAPATIETSFNWFETLKP
ncbi:MAG: hypothetical protein MUO76_19890, partial [Anaerolineaceae bacterium]|nr:hypothetical protein [Anaerolineaceae bacterium]